MAQDQDWHLHGPISPDDPASPYLQWALSETEGEPVTAGDETPLSIRTPWLDRVVSAALGDEPRRWPAILRRALPGTVLAPPTAKPLDSKAEPSKPRLPHARDRVIMAVIDDGISFVHERFRSNEFDSRIDFLWLQGAHHDGANSDVPFGREFDRRQIEDLLRDHRRGRFGTLLDEDGLYRAAGALDMGSGAFQSLARRAGHGTAITDLAAGFAAGSDTRDRIFQSTPERMGVDPKSYDLALVTLPQSVTADTSGTFTEVFIILALIRLFDHIEQRSLRDGQDYPVVVNLSFGLTAGAKDGSSLLDRFIDQINGARGLDRAPVKIVMPAGNHRLAQSHAVLTAPLTDKDAPLFWRLLPDDPTASFLELWTAPLPARPDSLPFSLGLKRPGAARFATLEMAQLEARYDLLDGSSFLGRAYVQWVQGDGKTGRIRVTLALPATIPTGRAKGFVPSGDWQITVIPTPGNALPLWPMDLTIQRDDMIPGFRGGGRQSRFADHAYQTRDMAGRAITQDPTDGRGDMPYVRRAGTLNSLATARDTIVVGGCYADTLSAVGYSGEGSAASGVRSPDVVAPASVARARGAIRVAGARSGSRIGVEGTSAAAPTLARELAKATRPVLERPRLSGVALLRSGLGADSLPAVLPIAEDLTEADDEEKNASEAW